jgi:glycosyltransferase involved in cell wall biosynthesis
MNEIDLKYLMNKCKYHICPSYSEGFGHYINEGMSTDSTVITTALYPMNEHISDKICLFKVKQNNYQKVRLGVGGRLDIEDIELILRPIFQRQAEPQEGNRIKYLFNKNKFYEKINSYFKSIN